MNEREAEADTRVAIAVRHRTLPCRSVAHHATTAPSVTKEVEIDGSNRHGVSRDNALIKCHESAPLCASAV